MESVLGFIIENWGIVSSIILVIILFVTGKVKLVEAILKAIHIIEESSLQKMKAGGTLPSSATKKEAARKLCNKIVPKVVKPFLLIPGIKQVVNQYIDYAIDKLVKKDKSLREGLQSFIGF